MSEQNVWSRQNKTSGFQAKQRNNIPEINLLTSLECRILEVRNASLKLECRVEIIRKPINVIDNVWFPLQMTDTEFAERYGSVTDFNELHEKPLGSFTFRSPSYSTGKVSFTTTSSSSVANASTTQNESLSEIVLGFSKATGKQKKVKKASKGSNTAFSIEDNKVSINTDKTFVEVSDKGISMGGPTNYQALPSENTYGMLLKMQNPMLGLIPSTLATPIPLYTFKIPTEQIGIAVQLFSVAAQFLK